jgi:hypothetical protein
LFRDKVYVPDTQELRNIVLKEMDIVPYVGHGHRGYQKTIAAIRGQYFCPKMKNDVIQYIVGCMEFHKVKTEQKHPAGLLQPFPIPEWK